MLATRPPPAPLKKPPQRVVTTIRLRNTMFGLHVPLRGRDVIEDVTESTVLGFTHRRDASEIAARLAHHRAVTHRWPGRVLRDGEKFDLFGGLEDVIDAEEDRVLEAHGLRLMDEGFQTLVRRLSLEGIALQLVTDVDVEAGRLSTMCYRDRFDIGAVAVHYNTLLRLRSDKH